MNRSDFPVDLSAENEHGVLKDQEGLRNYLENNYDEEVVDDFYRQFGWMYDWKAHRRSEDGVKLAVAYARALNLNEEEIKSYQDIDPSLVTDEHVELASELHGIGKSWFREKFSDSLTVYRGFKDGGFKILNKMYEDDSETIELSDNVLNNWSWEIDTALEWGRNRSRSFGALARVERSIDDFIFTIDGIAGDYTNYHDSSLTFEGGVEIPKQNISVEISGADASVRDYEAESDEPMDRTWEFYEGSFYPCRSLEAQDMDAIKAAALQFDESKLGIILEDESVENMFSVLEKMNSFLENNLDSNDPKDEQVIEAAENTLETAEDFSLK